MIDIHVLTHEGTREDWLDQCLASLEGQPVVVHVVDNAGRSVGEGRSRGYRLGGCEFVGYVDSDDYVLPGHYTECLKRLVEHHAVVPKEYVEYPCGKRHKFPKSYHNGAVYRRKDVEPLCDQMDMAPLTVDIITRQTIAPAQLSHIGYVWRIHDGGEHRKINNDLLMREKAQWLQKDR